MKVIIFLVVILTFSFCGQIINESEDVVSKTVSIPIEDSILKINMSNNKLNKVFFDTSYVNLKTNLEYDELSTFQNVHSMKFYASIGDSAYKGYVSFIDSVAIDTIYYLSGLKTDKEDDKICIAFLDIHKTINNRKYHVIYHFQKESICLPWGQKIVKNVTQYYIDKNGFFIVENVSDDRLPCLVKDIIN
ncbi:MAG: hypothetical protein ACK4K0_01120 [Flavobacteriales bacterium]